VINILQCVIQLSVHYVLNTTNIMEGYGATFPAVPPTSSTTVHTGSKLMRLADTAALN